MQPNPVPDGSQPGSNDSLQPPASSLSPFPQPTFPRRPGETPRAFRAFTTFFQLGQARSHQAVADQLGEGLATVKNWASKYGWSERLLAFNSGLLQQEALDQAALQRQHAVEWAARLNCFREQEWEAAQKLITAVECFLESFGEEELHKMTLGQVSRALKISSAVGRQALAGVPVPESAEPEISPVQQQFLDAVKRIYGQPRVAAPEQPPVATN